MQRDRSESQTLLSGSAVLGCLALLLGLTGVVLTIVWAIQRSRCGIDESYACSKNDKLIAGIVFLVVAGLACAAALLGIVLWCCGRRNEHEGQIISVSCASQQLV